MQTTKYTTALEHRKLYPGEAVDKFLSDNIKKGFYIHSFRKRWREANG